MFSEGDPANWWPGESDYPSRVVLVKKLENDEWLVTYRAPDWEEGDPNWIVKEAELSQPKVYT